MGSVSIPADTPIQSSTHHLMWALLISMLLHGAMALTAHRLWPLLFSVEIKLPAPIINVMLVQPEATTMEPLPEPIVEPPPPPPKPKPVQKPKPLKPKPKPKPVKRIEPPKPDPVEIEPPIQTAVPPAPFPAPAPVNTAPTPITPQPVYRPEPAYPMLARRMGQQGTVVLELTLSPSGSVAQAHIVESSGFRSLDESALQTIKTWKFPANRFNGLSSFRQRVEFRLDG